MRSIGRFYWGKQVVDDWPFWFAMQPQRLRDFNRRDDRGTRYVALRRHPRHFPTPRYRWTGSEFVEFTARVPSHREKDPHR